MCEIKDVIGIDIDDIGYIENLLKLVFIVKKCENLKAVINGGVLLEISTKRRRQTFYKPSDIDLYSMINPVDEGIYSISK